MLTVTDDEYKVTTAEYLATHSNRENHPGSHGTDAHPLTKFLCDTAETQFLSIGQGFEDLENLRRQLRLDILDTMDLQELDVMCAPSWDERLPLIAAMSGKATSTWLYN